MHHPMGAFLPSGPTWLRRGSSAGQAHSTCSRSVLKLTKKNVLSATPGRSQLRMQTTDSTTGEIPFSSPIRPMESGELSRLLTAMEDSDSSVRLRALLACKDYPAEECAPVILKMFDRGEEELQNRTMGCLFLGYKPNSRSFEILEKIVANTQETPEVFSNAVAALGYLKDTRAIPVCLRILRDENSYWTARSSAAVSLGIIADAHPETARLVYDDLVSVVRTTDDSNSVLLQSCIGALGEVGIVDCVPIIKRFLKADDFPFAQCTCEALGRLPCEESLTALQELIDDGNAHVNVMWAAEISAKAVKDALEKKNGA